MNNKNRFFMHITLLFLCFSIPSLCMHESMQAIFCNKDLISSLDKKQLKQFKRRIKNNILHSLTTEEDDLKIRIVLRFFFLDNFGKKISLGDAHYYADNDIMYLGSLFINKNYRGLGLGKIIFSKIMKNIHEHFPHYEIVYWYADPFEKEKNYSITSEETEKAKLVLYNFYESCNATVNKNTGNCSINLKKTGYFDEH